ncbi:MAG: OmpH family outer membrane protein, partial [Gammaproteobacteria bacterium]
MIAAVGMLQAAPVHAEAKIGVLNFGRLIEESPQGKTLFETLGNEANAKRRELQNAATALQTKRDKLNKDRATMTPDQVSRVEKELRDGERDLARRQSEAQDELNDR